VNRKTPLLALLILFVSTAMASAQFGNPPWHLTDIWWDLGKPTEDFQSLSIDMEISKDIPPTSRFYLAAFGLGHLNGTAYYGGLQSNIIGWNSPEDHRRKYRGPGAIFSRWDERSLKAVRVAEGGFCESSGHEGNFIGVRNTFKWSKGKYTCKLTRQKTERFHGQPHTWVKMTVYSHAEKKTYDVGSLLFAGEKLKLGRRVASFVEIFGKRIPLKEIPKFTVTFDNVQVNGKAIKNLHCEARYPRNAPNYAKCEAVNKTGVRVTIGTPVKRTKRGHKVF